jgi:predicted transcriptional regulator
MRGIKINHIYYDTTEMADMFRAIKAAKASNISPVIRKMNRDKVRRLFITDKGKIVGVFTTSDITRLAARALSQN